MEFIKVTFEDGSCWAVLMLAAAQAMAAQAGGSPEELMQDPGALAAWVAGNTRMEDMEPWLIPLDNQSLEDKWLRARFEAAPASGLALYHQHALRHLERLLERGSLPPQDLVEMRNSLDRLARIGGLISEKLEGPGGEEHG